LRATRRPGRARCARWARTSTSPLEELRALAHGVYPSLLSDRGLEDALRSLLMRDRVEAVGGELTIDAAPGRGTRIAFGVPVVTRQR
jgi:signal transduction histidine kinase